MRAACVPLSLLLLVACEPSPPLGVSHGPIIGGTRDTGDPAVMFLQRWEGTKRLNGCTAFVVAEHVAISAAHCFNDVLPGQSFKLFPGSDATASSSLSDWIDVTEWKRPDNFNPTGAGSAFDIAMIATTTPLPATPIPLAQKLDGMIVGKTIRLVGYGLTDRDDPKSFGVKYEVTNTVTGLLDDYVRADEPSGYCLGDSGGPELLDVGGQEVAVALMDRRGQGPDGGICWTYAFAVRIDIWRDLLIDPFIATHDGVMAQPDMGPGPEGGEEGGCAVAGHRSPTGLPSLLALAIVAATIATLRLQARRRRPGWRA